MVPSAPGLLAGQSVQFQAIFPWPGKVGWSVTPATAGTITSTGRFTAAGSPGVCTVTAVWMQDPQVTAQAIATVLPPPPASESTSASVQASGQEQTAPGTGITNTPVLGELLPATVSTSANGAIQVRADFLPTGAQPSN